MSETGPVGGVAQEHRVQEKLTVGLIYEGREDEQANDLWFKKTARV